MKTEDKRKKALEKFVFELEKCLGDKIWSIYLFGSLTKGTAREGSDIDLLVVYSDMEERSFLEVVSEIGFNILMDTGELIEVIPMMKEEYEDSLGKSPFLWEVLQFGKPILTRLKSTEWKLEFRDYLELAEEYLRYAQDALKENKLLLPKRNWRRSKMKVKIENKLIGEGEPCFIVAEAGVNHNGSVEIAKKLIDVAKDAGTDAIKFQTFKAENVVIKNAEKAEYQERNRRNISG